MKQALVRIAAFAAIALGAPGVAWAQVQPVDPNTGTAWQPGDAPDDEAEELPAEPQQSEWTPLDQPVEQPATEVAPNATGSGDSVPGFNGSATDAQTTAAAASVPREDVFSAAENVFGKGAEGLAGILEDILKEQGEPIAYIAGEEASGAFIVGARWGSGVMRHKIEGDRVVYWTGPSIGFDVGADASKVFVLVYNLYDSQKLFRRYAGGEGRAYFVGGFTATYLRRGDVVLIPIRLGVGVRLGVNAGYMRFSEKNRWLPF
jgi:hypothetical protein